MGTKEMVIPSFIGSYSLKAKRHNVHYLQAGCGAPVVFVHGGASDSRDWIHAMASLSTKFSVYAPDLIGYGQSDRLGEGYYLSDFYEFLMEFLEILKLERPALVGHSLGGRICLETALRHPEKVAKLVLVDSMGFGETTLFGNALMTFFWVSRKVFHRPHPYPRLLVKPGEKYSWLCTERLPELKVPTLLVWKQGDPYFPLAHARRAKELIKGAGLAVIPGYGHAPHKIHSSRFNRILLDFLSQK